MDRFWVVGGEYSSLEFTSLRNGAPDVMGPFVSHDEARKAWRQVSEETRSRAMVRYAIAVEHLTLPH